VDRRDLLLGAAGTLLVSKPTLALHKPPCIGFIGSGSRSMNQGSLTAFRDGLGELGWGNVAILDRWSEGPIEQLPEIARKLAGDCVDILVTIGTAATLAARSVTTTIPIVFVGASDPVAVGIVATLTRPDGNATGFSLRSSELVLSRLQLLRELVPNVSRIAVLVQDSPGLEHISTEIRDHARRMGLEFTELVVTTGKTFELAFQWLHSSRCDAFYLESTPLGPSKRAEIIALAADARIPALYPSRFFATAGGLASLAPDVSDLFHRAAGFVDKLLNGAKPADLPVERPRKLELVINLTTAKTLGLHIAPPLLSRADEIIK
jgi:ABC-type uncharacterized transport system substrate-binding protein